jgi:transposase
VYNEAVGAVRQGEKPNFIALRNALAKVKGDDRPPCARGVHNKILARAVKQACDAYATNFAKMRAQGQSYKFQVRFRSLAKSSTEVLVLERGKEGPVKGFEAMATPVSTKRRDTARTECLLHLGGASFKDMGGVRLQDHDEVIARMVSEGKMLQEDAKIKWVKSTDSFYFVYTYVMPVPEDPDPEFKAKRVLSGDLGVAPFLQWYQLDGSHGACLDGINAELGARCAKLDALHSRVERRKTAHSRRPAAHRARPRDKRRKTVRRLRRKLARERVRLHNWVEGAHYDVANFLLERADVLVIPKIASARMSERATRSIRSRTVRTMLTLSPGEFCARLASKAAAYAGRHVFTHTGEPGTSKTASCCGWWNWGLRVGDKECACPRCHVTIDRQVNGARGNLLAALGVALGIGWDGASG